MPKEVNQTRKTYYRRGVLHICGDGALLRAPDDTLAQRGDDVYLRSVELDEEGRSCRGAVHVGVREETWLSWSEGREEGKPRSQGIPRKLYKRGGVVHLCDGNRLYRRPREGSAAQLETRCVVVESDEARAIVVPDGSSERETWERWTYGEETRRRPKNADGD